MVRETIHDQSMDFAQVDFVDETLLLLAESTFMQVLIHYHQLLHFKTKLQDVLSLDNFEDVLVHCSWVILSELLIIADHFQDLLKFSFGLRVEDELAVDLEELQDFLELERELIIFCSSFLKDR